MNGTTESNYHLCSFKGAKQVYSMIACDYPSLIRHHMESSVVFSSKLTGDCARFRGERLSYHYLLDYSSNQIRYGRRPSRRGH